MSGRLDNRMSRQLPGGGALAPGETVLVSERFMLSTVVFYLHTEIVLTNRRLYAMRPNTLGGLIPVGTDRSNFPIENIAGVSAATHVAVLGVIVGALAILLGLSGLSSPQMSTLAILLLVIGVLLIIAAPKQAIEVMNSGGDSIWFPVSVFQRSRTVDFADRVSEAVARTPGRPNAKPPSPTGLAPDPTEALRQLHHLREQGLVTEAEYMTKRTDILGRL